MKLNRVTIALLAFVLIASCKKFENISAETIEEKTALEITKTKSKSETESQLLKSWYLPFKPCTIDFFDGIDGRYTLGYPVGGGKFCYGNYKITNDNEILIYFPDREFIGETEITDKTNFKPNEIEIIEWLFADDNKVTFIYDPTYIDFYTMTCLRNGDKKLTCNTPSPIGEKYILDGAEVIKYDRDTSFVKLNTNMRMRKKPSFNAEYEIINYSFRSYNSVTSDLVFDGSVHPFDAKTIENFDVDGVAAPWYHIEVFGGGDEDWAYRVWIFGGYLTEINSSIAEESTDFDKKYGEMVRYGIIEYSTENYKYFEYLVENGDMKTNPLKQN